MDSLVVRSLAEGYNNQAILETIGNGNVNFNVESEMGDLGREKKPQSVAFEKW